MEAPAWTVLAGRIGLAAGVIVIWEVLARLKIINPFMWSMPSLIAAEFWRTLRDGELATDASFTFSATIIGFIIGTVSGAALGLSFWWSTWYAKVAEPFIIVFEGIPKLALAPIVILVLGLGIESKIGMAVALTIVISALTTSAGMRAVDRDLVRLVFALGASRWQVFSKVILPGTFPAILSAMRINIGLAARRRDRRRVHRLETWSRALDRVRRRDVQHRPDLVGRVHALAALGRALSRHIVAREHALAALLSHPSPPLIAAVRGHFMARVWDKFITEQDRLVWEASGYGARGGYGTRPAVIIVDVNYAFTGEKSMPILDSIKTWRNSCGSNGWDALPPTQKLLAAARAQHIPVFYSTGIDSRPDGFDRGGWAHKNNRAKEDLTEVRKVAGVRGNDIVKEIAPMPHEIVLEKLKPSAFHGTALMGYLTDLGVNTADHYGHHHVGLRPRDRARCVLAKFQDHAGRGMLL